MSALSLASAKAQAHKAAVAARERALVLQGQAQTAWAQYKPVTPLGWLAFAGAALLAMSALSTALTVLSAFLVGLGWLGLGIYAVAMSLATAGSFFGGSVALFFSGTCAVAGTTVLSCACGAYVATAVAVRIRSVGGAYLQQAIAANQQRAGNASLPPTPGQQCAALPASTKQAAPAAAETGLGNGAPAVAGTASSGLSPPHLAARKAPEAASLEAALPARVLAA